MGDFIYKHGNMIISWIHHCINSSALRKVALLPSIRKTESYVFISKLQVGNFALLESQKALYQDEIIMCLSNSHLSQWCIELYMSRAIHGKIKRINALCHLFSYCGIMLWIVQHIVDVDVLFLLLPIISASLKIWAITSTAI